MRYQLDPLDGPHTGDYIRRHLHVAARSDPLFADAAITAIAHVARGLARQSPAAAPDPASPRCRRPGLGC